MSESSELSLESLREDFVRLQGDHQTFRKNAEEKVASLEAREAEHSTRVASLEADNASLRGELEAAKAAVVRVPVAVSGVRAGADLASMTPLEKISYGLSIKGSA